MIVNMQFVMLKAHTQKKKKKKKKKNGEGIAELKYSVSGYSVSELSKCFGFYYLRYSLDVNKLFNLLYSLKIFDFNNFTLS
jgi:hypothetical protein